MNAKNAVRSLEGSRILIVEDDFLLATYLQKLVEKAGGQVVGLAGTLDKALALVERAAPDVAVLDVNLGNASTRPVAEALDTLKVPFVVVTGYGDNDLRAEVLREAPRLDKPVKAEALIEVLCTLARPQTLRPQASP